MSDKKPPPPGFSAWFSRTSRASQPVQLDLAAPPRATGPTNSAPVVPDTQPTGGNRQKKAKKYIPLDLSVLYAGPSQQSNWRAPPRVNDARLAYNRNPHEGNNNNRFGASRHSNSGRPGAGGQSDMGGLSRAMGNMSVSTPRINTNRVQRGPLTEFRIFGRLPAEIRAKIYELSMNKNRILEVIWGDADKDPKNTSHDHHRLAPRSCTPPALLHVCKESRGEALRFYKVVDFTGRYSSSINFKGCKSIKTYFNADWDIVYFGEHTCIRTIVCFIEGQASAMPKVELHRIAIQASGSLLQCHDWDHHDPIHGINHADIDYGYAVAGGCTMMQALHGIHKKIAWTDKVPGVQGLKEVYFVVPTHLLPGIAGNVDESIGFRPARGDGMTAGQIKLKTRSIQRDLDRVADGSVLPHCSIDDSLNNWEGDKKPNFQFVSLTPVSQVQGKIFDSKVVPTDDLAKLNGKRWEFVKQTQRSTNCHIKIPDQEYPGQPVREIGFYGKEADVAKAMKAVEDRLVHLSGDNWVMPKNARTRYGFTSYMRLDLKLFHPEAAAARY